MFTTTLTQVRPGSSIDISSIHVLGSNRDAVHTSLRAASSMDIHVVLAGVDLCAGTPITNAKLRELLAPLPSGTSSGSTTMPVTTHVRMKHASSHEPEEFISIAHQDPGNHYASGSRHVCWCGATPGRRRKLEEITERQIVAQVLSPTAVHDVAAEHDISTQLVYTTMKRYGYVRTGRVANATKKR